MGKKELKNAIDVSKVPRNKPLQYVDADSLKRLAGKDMSYATYPILMDFSDPKFQLRTLDGLENVSPTSLRELNVRSNKLATISQVAVFSRLCYLDAQRNLLSSVVLEHTMSKLEVIDLSHNQINEIPDLSKMPNIREVDLSQNLITGKNPFGPLAGKKAKKLKWLDLGFNGIDLNAFDFVKALEVLSKDNVPKLRYLDLRGNRVTKIPHYRAYTVTRVNKDLAVLDDKPILKSERKEKPPIPVAEKESTGEDVDVPKKTVEQEDSATITKKTVVIRQIYVFQNMKGMIVKCFEQPLEAPNLTSKLEEHVSGMCKQPADFRSIDYSPLEPADSISEFMESLTLLMQRLPQLASVCTRIMARLISVTENPIGDASRAQLIQLLDMQGMYDEPIWLAVRDVIVPEMIKNLEDKALIKRYIEVLFLASQLDVKDFHTALTPLLPALSKALQESELDPHLLGILAAAARDEGITQKLYEHGVCERIVLLFHDCSEFPRSDAFKFLVRIVQSTSNASNDVLSLYIEKNIHNSLLILVDDMNFEKNELWSDDDSAWATDIIACVNTMTRNDRVLSIALQSSYVQRLLEIIEFPDVSVRLMSRCLNAIRHVLEHAKNQKSLFDEIGKSLGYVVPLLDYVEGLSYDSVCIQAGSVKHGEPIPLNMQKNPQIHEMLVEIVSLIQFYAICTNENSDSMACQVNTALDSAGRERYLLALLSVPNDNVRVATVNCLANIPLSNLDPHEIDEIVHLLEMKDVEAGRTEEVLATVLRIVTAVVSDKGDQGKDFRSRKARSIKKVLRLLERTSARDTTESETETREKLELSDACIGFLLASSTWKEAVDLMRDDESLKIIKNIFMFEDVYGVPDHPIWLEKTAAVSTTEVGFACLEGLQVTGNVAHRVVARMAEIIEGPGRALPVEDEDLQDAKIWAKVVADVDTDDKEFRLDQAEFFAENDGITRLVNYLRNGSFSSTNLVDDIDPIAYQPRDITSGILAEMHMLEEEHTDRKANTGALGDDEDEHNVGAELDIERLKRLEYDTNMKKRRMLESATHHLQTDDDFADVDMELELPKPLGVLTPSSGTLIFDECAHAPILAATLRLFIAVLWYARAQHQNKIRMRLREVLTLRTLGILCRNAGWYPHNVACRFLLVIDELLCMPAMDVEEPITSIPLFDVMAQIMEVILKSTDDQLSSGMLLTQRQELVVLRICQTFEHILKQAKYIPLSSVQDNINDEGLKAIYEVLLPPAVLNMVIRYIYYDYHITHNFIQETDHPHQLQLRDFVRNHALGCIATYITIQTDNRYAILEHFNRLELSERLSLPPAQLQYVLDMSIDVAYHRALEKLMADKFYMPAQPERILWQAWISMTSDELNNDYRLLVFTNTAYYILKEPFGLKCKACTRDKFCPRGPDLKARRLIKDITKLTIGYGSHMLQVDCVDPKFTGKAKMHFSIITERMNEIDTLVASLRQLLDASIPIVDDRMTQAAYQQALVNPSMEIIWLITPVKKVNIRGAVQDRVIALTNSGIYNFKISPKHWLGNETTEKGLAKFAVLRSHYELKELEKIEVGSDLTIRFEFAGARNFYEIRFGDFHIKELWRRSLAQRVDSSMFV